MGSLLLSNARSAEVLQQLAAACLQTWGPTLRASTSLFLRSALFPQLQLHPEPSSEVMLFLTSPAVSHARLLPRQLLSALLLLWNMQRHRRRRAPGSACACNRGQPRTLGRRAKVACCRPSAVVRRCHAILLLLCLPLPCSASGGGCSTCPVAGLMPRGAIPVVELIAAALCAADVNAGLQGACAPKPGAC